MRLSVIAALWAAGAVAPVLAWGQTIYRCGNRYSDTPCPNATVLELADPRSDAQRAQSEQATRRDQQAADAMESRRLAQQRQAEAAGRDTARLMQSMDAAQRPLPPAAETRARVKARKRPAAPQHPGSSRKKTPSSQALPR